MDSAANNAPVTAPAAPLPWPPPGLEALRGRASVLSRSLGIASLCIMASLVEYAIVGSSPTPQLGGIGTLFFCMGLAFTGFVLQMRAAYGVWRALSEGGMSAWRGYTWLTIGEVMADGRGDTGALISGAGVFASLTPETRSTVRVIRTLAGFGRIVAGVLPLPAFLFAASLGASQTIGPALAVVITLAPSAFVLIGVWIAERMESVALKPARDEVAKVFERRTSAIAIADKWYAAFDEARAGHGLGRGRAGGVLRAWVVGAAGALVLLGIAVLFVPLWYLATIGAARPAEPYSSTVRRMSDVAPLRFFRIAIDSTISPQRAGDALQSIDQSGAANRQPWTKPPLHTYAAWPEGGSALFPMRGSTGWTGPRSPDVLDVASKGLTSEQHAYLQRIAASPIWEDFTTVARAQRVDIAGGRFVVPLPDAMTAFDIPYPRFAGSREIAYANTSRAAWYLADGKRNDAERVLRETISYGFHLMDDGNSTIEVLIGASVVGVGRDALARLFRLIGDTRDTMLVRRIQIAARSSGPVLADVPVTSVDSRSTGPVPVGPRGDRLEGVLRSSIQTCGSMRGLLFGPSRLERNLLPSLRARLVRSPAEGALFDLYTTALDRRITAPSGTRPQQLSQRLFGLSARVTGAVLGNKRITNCAVLQTMR